MPVDYDPDSYAMQARAAVFAYAFRCAADSMPPAPHYDRFIREIARSFFIPAFIFKPVAYSTQAYALVPLFEKAYRSAMFSAANPGYRPPDFSRHDTEFVRALARALDHADLFHRTAQYVPYRPYASDRQVQYLQTHAYLVTRPSARDPFLETPAISDDDPVIVSLFRIGYFRNPLPSAEGD